MRLAKTTALALSLAACLWSGAAAAETCAVTVPELQSINCAAYPSSLQSFCYTFKPYMMNSGECHEAEAWAKKQPHGSQENACRKESFEKGTGSESYVWACSQLSKQADPPKEKDDPQCYKRLEGMGVQFTKLGDLFMGYEPLTGTECWIKNAVGYAGTAVPLGNKFKMSCPLAESFEKYSRQMKGMGVTRYESLGAFNCRTIRNANGVSRTISQHGKGNAIDIGAYYVGTQKISVGAWIGGNPADKAFLEQAHSAACSAFSGVLGPEFYANKYHHFHFEVNGKAMCNR